MHIHILACFFLYSYFFYILGIYNLILLYIFLKNYAIRCFQAKSSFLQKPYNFIICDIARKIFYLKTSLYFRKNSLPQILPEVSSRNLHLISCLEEDTPVIFTSYYSNLTKIQINILYIPIILNFYM